MSQGFLDPQILLGGGPRRLLVSLERVFRHLAFDEVRNIDGPGDKGGDLIATRGHVRFVVQAKWTTRASVGRSAVDELERAKTIYRADRAVLATNGSLDGVAKTRIRGLASVGVGIDVWDGPTLQRIYAELPDWPVRRLIPRPYQVDAIRAIEVDLHLGGRALLILATGLGKTVVGGEVIGKHLAENPADQILVVAHMKALVAQLERAVWQHLPKQVPTQSLTGDDKPAAYSGVTFATIESALGAVETGVLRPGLVMVDETHHVAESGQFQELLDRLSSSRQLGVTATPWRGDGFDISRRFGRASYTMGIAEGMAAGYLAQADYRLMVDDVDWDTVSQASHHGYTVRELNERLIIPQRDEAAIDAIRDAWANTRSPRAIVFCRTIDHAERIASRLATHAPDWSRATCLHSGQTRRDRELLLADFRVGRIPIITVVDIFNEGLDVPDVNIVAFMRVTHSRRIFVQQLGRGLRLSPGKDHVVVLDFVTDIRRIAAVLQLRRSLDTLSPMPEVLNFPASQVTFSNATVGSLMDQWIRDASELETTSDEARLQFPEYLAPP